MKEKTIRLRRKKGPYRSDIRKFSIEGIEIDNYFKVKVYEKKKLVDTIIEKRKLPEKVKPPHVVPPPTADAKLLLIDHKDPFWILDPEVKRDITCWVTRTDEGETFLVDAVTGKEVGKGVPAPSNRSTAISGYCAGYNDPWKGYRANAASYFNRWGNSAWNVYAPSKFSVGIAVRDKSYKMHYALAHGDWNRFQVQARSWVYASDIRSYMAGGSGSSGGSGPDNRPDPAPGGRPPFQFAFLGQCGAFTKTGSGTISHAFMKGQTKKTCCIGYYNAHLSAGWRYSLKWQSKLFSMVNSGYSFYTAFVRANAAYTACRDMTRFVGDTSVTKAVVDYGDEYDDNDSGDDSGDDGGQGGGGRGGQGGGGGPKKRGGGGSGGDTGRGRGGQGGGGGGPAKR